MLVCISNQHTDYDFMYTLMHEALLAAIGQPEGCQRVSGPIRNNHGRHPIRLLYPSLT